jgi:hypothetical protein
METGVCLCPANFKLSENGIIPLCRLWKVRFTKEEISTNNSAFVIAAIELFVRNVCY